MKFFKFFLKWGVIFSLITTIALAITILFYCHDLPDIDDIEQKLEKQKIIQINYSNENKIVNRGNIYSNSVSYYELPKNLINAVVSIEDRRFFSHNGIDIFGIIRAYHANKSAGRIVQGGSTITQQLAKLLFLKSEKTFKRKIQEVILAIKLERKYTKEQILTFYLNRAYFGSGNYGVIDASKHYFNKTISDLNLQESALLAGLLKAPSKISPKNNAKLAKARTNTVIKAMIDAGYLNEKDFSNIEESISYYDDHGQRFYFADYVYQQFNDFLNDEVNQNDSNLVIDTTLDEIVQENLEKTLNKFVKDNHKKLGKSEIAVVIMDKTGGVIGMSGGKDYQSSQFNRAIYSKRQAGSAFKTFVYLTALEEGINFNDVYEDKKINIGAWIPENYDGKYFGEVSLKEAFANSLNSIAIQLSRKVGVDSIIKMARMCGIVSPITKKDLTIALGSAEVSLYELTSAYTTIVNNGFPIIPYTITKIKNEKNQILYQRNSSGMDPVISKENIKSIKEMMREVVDSGTGKNANVNRNIYGKTGTSQDYRDAWFIGSDDEKIVGIWIGNDDNSPTNKITGGSLPAILFANIINNV
jgi:penicillin-binding protein 1A